MNPNRQNLSTKSKSINNKICNVKLNGTNYNDHVILQNNDEPSFQLQWIKYILHFLNNNLPFGEFGSWFVTVKGKEEKKQFKKTAFWALILLGPHNVDHFYWPR